MPFDALRHFLKLESASGILLVVAGVLAMLAANSPLAGFHGQLLDLPLAIHIGTFAIAKPLLLWINDGLMAIFFLLIGLEVKREILEGELADKERLALPAFGAAGGMVVPALLYVWCNWGNAAGLRGWAIPSATDIPSGVGARTRAIHLVGNAPMKNLNWDQTRPTSVLSRRSRQTRSSWPGRRAWPAPRGESRGQTTIRC